MAIYIPGKRDTRHRNRLHGARRTVTAGLTLTSMVDMFTILVVFLLQNYSSTGEIIYIPKNVRLPEATQTKELKPAHIVIITQDDLILDKDKIVPMTDVRNQKDWLIPALQQKLTSDFDADDAKAKSALAPKLQNALPGAKSDQSANNNDNRRKITVQADKDLDFLTLKKVMFTVTEAGAAEINFAVAKKEQAIPPQ